MTDPFTVAASSNGVPGAPGEVWIATGIPITWTGEVDLSDGFGTTLFEIEMEGVGTASYYGTFESPIFDGYSVVGADASLTGEAQATPEPSTITLLGIAGIASILGIRFRHII